MESVAENACCCRSTVSESGVRHHREGVRDYSKPERLDRGALGDEDSPTTTEITDLSARVEKVKTNVVFMQVRFLHIDPTSNLAHRKHAFSLITKHLVASS